MRASSKELLVEAAAPGETAEGSQNGGVAVVVGLLVRADGGFVDGGTKPTPDSSTVRCHSHTDRRSFGRIGAKTANTGRRRARRDPG
jgi:hypothetical protein